MDKKENILDDNISKEEKNLFSIASQEIEEEQKINSFSDAIKELDESPKEEISFGNLFQTATETSDSLEEDTKTLETEIDAEIPTNGLDLNTILKQEKEEVEEISTDNTINFDDETMENEPTIEADLNSFSEISTKEEDEFERPKPQEIKKEESPIETVPEPTPIVEIQPEEVEESNPFISTEPQEVKKEESPVEIVPEPTPIVETQPEEVEESNPFISTEPQEVKKEESPVESVSEPTPIVETQPEEVEESNPFISTEPQEVKKEESPVEIVPEPTPIVETQPEEVEESNSFISTEPQEIKTEENTVESVSEPTAEATPFIQAPSENKEQENPFITNTSEENNTETKTINDALEAVKDKIETNNPFIIEDSEDKVPPTSNDNSAISETTKVNEQNNPFFQNTTFDEKTNTEINPFFQNKIELNEKQTHQNNNKLDLSDVPHYNVKIQKKKPKKSKLIIGVLSYAVFIWLLLIGITLLIYVANIKIKEMKGDFSPPKYNAYVVLTGSMLPHIQVEDVVVTKKIDAAELEEGDIITFASSDDRYYGTIITHRIQKKFYDSTTGKYTFQSKGDNNNVADNALVEEDNIYGKVILKIPKLGYLQVFLASKGGWILVILIPCAVVISFDIMKLFKMIARKRKLKIVK